MSDEDTGDELDAAAGVLGAAGLAAQVYDDEGRLRWVSEELLALIGADLGEEVGVGLLPAEAEAEADGRAWWGILGDVAFDVLMAGELRSGERCSVR